MQRFEQDGLEPYANLGAEPVAARRRKRTMFLVCGGLFAVLLVIGLIVGFTAGSKDDGPSPSPGPSPPGPSPTTTASPDNPIVDCSDDSITAGCASCYKDGSCSCIPGYNEHDKGCAKATEPQLMTFYMYRAQNDEDYPLDNNNAASLEGVVWYVHNEVVRLSCPRHYNITRIKRFKITMENTPELFAERSSQFGPFVAMDKASCTVPDCSSLWDKYGYITGCQKQTSGTGQYYGLKTIWYSLVGACPEMPFDQKTDECKKEHPGGQCSSPDGSKTCTWKYEPAGEISLDELEGIDDYAKFCSDGNREYVPETDKGVGCSFWDGLQDPEANAKRVKAAAALFLKKFPDMPLTTPTPLCDW
eukprot:CAMPEP_0204332174 /NCGR_PEP_ID=MMETSP0469-20131031/16263_1 /ASSEMBLY_ACC=CAM_ASM_000384 /TAXON_ID=2969 /ORGANISM="Oxyrrhis marina" /LENGTH=359 /DNA_ID=CAMNT_0051315285 /DNA_START=27 /DNA_END=1106 /DNA_ORIENTATION=+